jgi:multidrug efflux pump subunit AcrA (membrane-fusion protein)
LKATVILRRGERSITWPAGVSRLAESLDPQTQTLGVIISVNNPYGTAEPGVRPPLAPNTFVEVELRGGEVANQVIIPESVIRESKIYVVNKESRLDIRRVKLGYRQGRFAIIAEGLVAGERVVASDLIPAINGMLLDAELDERLTQSMREFASKVTKSRAAKQ